MDDQIDDERGVSIQILPAGGRLDPLLLEVFRTTDEERTEAVKKYMNERGELSIVPLTIVFCYHGNKRFPEA